MCKAHPIHVSGKATYKCGLIEHLWILVTKYMLITHTATDSFFNQEHKLQNLHYKTDFQFFSDPYKQMICQKVGTLFPYQKPSFNEDSLTEPKIMTDCSIPLVTEMANENRWQAYIHRHGKKELTDVKVAKEMNSDSLNVSFINIV